MVQEGAQFSLATHFCPRKKKKFLNMEDWCDQGSYPWWEISVTCIQLCLGCVGAEDPEHFQVSLRSIWPLSCSVPFRFDASALRSASYISHLDCGSRQVCNQNVWGVLPGCLLVLPNYLSELTVCREKCWSSHDQNRCVWLTLMHTQRVQALGIPLASLCLCCIAQIPSFTPFVPGFPLWMCC